MLVPSPLMSGSKLVSWNDMDISQCTWVLSWHLESLYYIFSPWDLMTMHWPDAVAYLVRWLRVESPLWMISSRFLLCQMKLRPLYSIPSRSLSHPCSYLSHLKDSMGYQGLTSWFLIVNRSLLTKDTLTASQKTVQTQALMLMVDTDLRRTSGSWLFLIARSPRIIHGRTLAGRSALPRACDSAKISW